MPKLFALADKEGVAEHAGMNRGQLIAAVVRHQIERGTVVRGCGTLEVLPDGYGFLRSTAHNYLASPEDIYVSPSQIRRLGLRTGLIVEGPIRLPVEGQENFALMQVEVVNYHPPEEKTSATIFEDLTPLHPNRRVVLETGAEEIAMRVVDLVTPIGKGQRGLIVSPPRAGKTVLLQKIALSVRQNHPECYLIVLLVDERPEEVTDMVRTVAGPTAEVVASTFDEPAGEHIHVSDIALEKAKRLIEHGKDVVILLDSITRLARAYNTEAPSGGKLLSGGLDSNAMQKPKRFFGAAQRRGRRQPHDPRHRPHRHRQPNGRGHLRGIQRYRQHGAASRPAPGGQARLAGHRHQPVGYSKGRAAASSGRGRASANAPPSPCRHAPGGSNGTLDHSFAENQIKRGIPAKYEHVVETFSLPDPHHWWQKKARAGICLRILPRVIKTSSTASKSTACLARAPVCWAGTSERTCRIMAPRIVPSKWRSWLG